MASCEPPNPNSNQNTSDTIPEHGCRRLINESIFVLELYQCLNQVAMSNVAGFDL